jgi:hypothetical protein
MSIAKSPSSRGDLQYPSVDLFPYAHDGKKRVFLASLYPLLDKLKYPTHLGGSQFLAEFVEEGEAEVPFQGPYLNEHSRLCDAQFIGSIGKASCFNDGVKYPQLVKIQIHISTKS